MWHLIGILRWVLIIRVDAGGHSSDILREIACCPLGRIACSALLASWRNSVLVWGRSGFSTAHAHLGFAEHGGRGCGAAERCWWRLVYWKIVLDNGCSWGIQDFVSDVFEGAIHRETPILNLLICLLLVHYHGRLQMMMVVVLVAQSPNPSRLVHYHPLCSLLLAIIITRLLTAHFWNLRTPVSPGSIRCITSIISSCPMLWHVQMIGAKPNLGVPRGNIHALSPIHEVRGIDILIFGLMIEATGASISGSMATRASTPDTLQHLLFLSDSRANVVDNTVDAADPLQLTRWVWHTRARPTHLLLRLRVICTC